MGFQVLFDALKAEGRGVVLLDKPTEALSEVLQNDGHQVGYCLARVVGGHVKANLDVVDELELRLLFNQVFLELVKCGEDFSQNTPIVRSALRCPELLCERH